MFADKSTAGNGTEAIVFQNVPQFDEGIVEVAVAEGYHRHCISFAAHNGFQIRQQYVGYTACNNGSAKEHQICFGEGDFFLPYIRQCKIIYFHRNAKAFCHMSGYSSHSFFSTAGGAEIHGPYFFDFHCKQNSFLSPI